MPEKDHWTKLTGFQRDLLVIVAALGPRKGLAIKEELDDYYGTEINHGRLYPNLDTLAESGLVEKGEIDDRTNSYELTHAGKRTIRARWAWKTERIESDDA